MSRSVLVLTHGFLPWAGAPAERVSRFCTHLRAYGWEPSVLCASVDSFHAADDPRAAELWQDWRCRRVGDHATWPLYRAADRVGLVRPFRLLLTLATGFPDIYRWWAEQAKTAGEELCRAVRPDVILSSSPPHSVHLVARHLSERFGVPWVMDLRDAWRGNRRARYVTGWHRRASDRHYDRCIRQADRIIANSDRLARMVAADLGGRADGIDVITNGYEESLFAGITPTRLVPDGSHVVLYSGATFGGFVDGIFRELVRALERAGAADPIKLVIVGDPPASPAPASPFGPISLGYRSQVDVPGTLLGADVLVLVMEAPSKEIRSATISLKTYGYLRSGRPILYVGPEGANWDLIKAFPGTEKFDYGAWDAMAARLRELCRRREDWTEARREAVGAFSWKALAGRLAASLDAAAARRLARTGS